MRVFVYHTVKLYFQTGEVSDNKRSGRPHVVCMPQVRSRNNRNPVRKQKLMAWEMDIAPRTMGHIIKDGLLDGVYQGFSATRQMPGYLCTALVSSHDHPYN